MLRKDDDVLYARAVQLLDALTEAVTYAGRERATYRLLSDEARQRLKAALLDTGGAQA